MNDSGPYSQALDGCMPKTTAGRNHWSYMDVHTHVDLKTRNVFNHLLEVQVTDTNIRSLGSDTWALTAILVPH